MSNYQPRLTTSYRKFLDPTPAKVRRTETSSNNIYFAYEMHKY